jgi:uncharacterized protein YjbI with pentapeptide repeats
MKTNTRPTIQPPQIPRHLPAGSPTILEDRGEYAMQAWSGCNLSGLNVTLPVFEHISFRRVTLGPSRHTRPRFIDCRLEACDLSAILWEQARFRRVEFVGCRLTGAQLLEAELEDVAFKECSLQSAAFSSARFKAVRFDNCLLNEASFEGADCGGVIFTDCDLAQADLRQAKLGGADLRGSRLGGVQVGALELKGVIVDSVQAVQIAGLIGLVVREKGEEISPDEPTIR